MSNRDEHCNCGEQCRSETVRCRRLVIVDEDGHERAVIGATGDLVALEMTDSQGAAGLNVSVSHNGWSEQPSLAMWDGEKVVRMILGLWPDNEADMPEEADQGIPSLDLCRRGGGPGEVVSGAMVAGLLRDVEALSATVEELRRQVATLTTTGAA